MDEPYDVVVVGAGNAAFSAAHAAREEVARVCMLEKAPRESLGGNSYFTMGSFRTTYQGLEDLAPILTEAAAAEAADFDLPPYAPEDFRADMDRLTQGRCDPELTEILIEDSPKIIRWLHSKGTRWELQTAHQTYEVDGVRRFWGGGTLCTEDGGKGLIEQHLAQAERTGIEVRTEHQVVDFVVRDGRVGGVVCQTPTGRVEVPAKAVVLASGGFEANARLRAAYLGPDWDTAKVRGSRHNTGEGLEAALRLGAQSYGNWSGAHAVSWDAAAPGFGDRDLTNKFSRHSYPHGLMVNRDGKRFVDEGADFRNYTYAKYGKEVLKQPGSVAFQLFDAKSARMLRRSDYDTAVDSRVEADTVEELAERLGINETGLVETVKEYNAAVLPGAFNAAIRDGKGTQGIEPPKSNWAQTFDEPPFLGFATVCGITFTFGGIKIDPQGRALDHADAPIPGLHAAGELVGGLFHHNYPGGSGLMAGAVFGHRAGKSAAELARRSG